MKKIISVFLFAIILINAKAQTKDSTKQDSIKTFVIIVNENEYNALINVIKEADEKPSIINAWLQFLSSRTQIITPPNKEQPKK